MSLDPTSAPRSAISTPATPSTAQSGSPTQSVAASTAAPSATQQSTGVTPVAITNPAGGSREIGGTAAPTAQSDQTAQSQPIPRRSHGALGPHPNYVVGGALVVLGGAAGYFVAGGLGATIGAVAAPVALVVGLGVRLLMALRKGF